MKTEDLSLSLRKFLICSLFSGSSHWTYAWATCAPKAKEEKSSVCRWEYCNDMGWPLTMLFTHIVIPHWVIGWIKWVAAEECVEECMAHSKLGLCACAIPCCAPQSSVDKSLLWNRADPVLALPLTIWGASFSASKTGVGINKFFFFGVKGHVVIIFIFVSPTASVSTTQFVFPEWKQP